MKLATGSLENFSDCHLVLSISLNHWEVDSLLGRCKVIYCCSLAEIDVGGIVLVTFRVETADIRVFDEFLLGITHNFIRLGLFDVISHNNACYCCTLDHGRCRRCFVLHSSGLPLDFSHLDVIHCITLSTVTVVNYNKYTDQNYWSHNQTNDKLCISSFSFNFTFLLVILSRNCVFDFLCFTGFRGCICTIGRIFLCNNEILWVVETKLGNTSLLAIKTSQTTSFKVKYCRRCLWSNRCPSTNGISLFSSQSSKFDFFNI